MWHRIFAWNPSLLTYILTSLRVGGWVCLHWGPGPGPRNLGSKHHFHGAYFHTQNWIPCWGSTYELHAMIKVKHSSFTVTSSHTSQESWTWNCESPKESVQKAVLAHLQNHVVWSRTLECSVKSCSVTWPSRSEVTTIQHPKLLRVNLHFPVKASVRMSNHSNLDIYWMGHYFKGMVVVIQQGVNVWVGLPSLLYSVPNAWSRGLANIWDS